MYVIVFTVMVLASFLAWGWRLPRTTSVVRDILINAPVEEVWSVVTDYLGHVKWRTDLLSVRIGSVSAGGESWIEQPRRGGQVTLRILRSRQSQLLEMERSRKGCRGQWTGTFEKAANATRVRILAATTISNPLARVFSQIFFHRGLELERYLRDLKNYIETGHGAGSASAATGRS